LRRGAFLEATRPNRSVIPLSVRDGHRRRVDAPGIGRFAFRPTVSESDHAVVRVSIFEEHDGDCQELGAVTVGVGGPPADYAMTSSFRIIVKRLALVESTERDFR